MPDLSLEHDNALGDWWCDVRDEHGTHDFENSVRAAVAAEAAGQEWVPTAESWAPNEVREFLDALFGSDEQAFSDTFMESYTVETGADESQVVVGAAWRTLRAMGRAEGVRSLNHFFGGDR